MSRRFCSNCHANEWPRYRYCRECWWAMFKGAAAAIGGALATWLVAWLSS